MARHTLPRTAPGLPPTTPRRLGEAARRVNGGKIPLAPQPLAATAVAVGMKLRLALATMIIGITAAVLARPVPETAPAAAPGPELPALVAPAVTTGRSDALPGFPGLPPAGVAQRAWDMPAVAPPGGLPAGGQAPSGAMLGNDDPLSRLQAAPLGWQPAPHLAESADTLLGDASVAESEPVPEPAMWLLMLAGFGLVGVAARRHHLATL